MDFFLKALLVKNFTSMRIGNARHNKDMANLFPRSANFLIFKIAICLGAAVTGVVLAVSYYATGKTLDVGYEPDQPIPYDHALHAGVAGLDCRHCHSFVDKSGHANVPSASVCAGCHAATANHNLGVKHDSEKLRALREALDSGKPIRWVKVWDSPDYVYFDHSAHVNRGVSCVTCHDDINKQRVVYRSKAHTMGFCIDCHKSPENHLRPLEYVYDLDWTAKTHLTKDENAELYDKLVVWHEGRARKGLENVKLNKQSSGDDYQKAFGLFLKETHHVNAKISCQTCHN
jgi:hypothetical protein